MVKLNVFLVCDKPEMAVSLERQSPVHVVATARDGSGAMHWLTQAHNDADLVTVDLFLEAGSGLGVLRRCRGLRHRRKLVVLSNFASDDLRRTCKALGAARVFDKTTEVDSLLAYCENLAASSALH